MPNGDCYVSGYFDSATGASFDNINFIPTPAVASNYFLAKLAASPTGFPEATENQEIFLYPNPASSAVTIKNLSKEEAGLKIFNVTGRQVFETVLETEARIDLGNYPAGMYLLKLISEGKTNTQKLIVTH